MSLQLYKYLKETMLLNDFKDDVIPALHKAQDLISEYIIIDDKDKNKSVLRSLSDTLEIVVNKFNNLDYNYEPEVQPDVSEDTFRNTLDKYKKEISNFISNFTEDRFQSFNSQTRYIINLIDIHLSNVEGRAAHEK